MSTGGLKEIERIGSGEVNMLKDSRIREGLAPKGLLHW